MENEKERFKKINMAGIIGIIGNILLLFLKATTGFIFKSQAMIADSMNSAGDIFSSIMTTIGNRIASTPSDTDHNLGHGKAEYIFSMFIAIAMILVSAKLLFDDISNLINHENEITFSWLLVIAAILTIVIKLGMFTYTYIQSKKIKSILLEANMKDHRNDVIVAIFTLISIIASKFDYGVIDDVVGIGISIWIAYTGIKIFIQSYDILMDKSIDEDTRNRIIKIVEKYPEIKKYYHLNSSPVGVKYMISISIFVDGNMSTFASHEIANKLEKEITGLNNIQLTIVHVNPI